MMFVCKIVTVSGIVRTVLLQSTMLCIAKAVHILLRSITVFCSFYENLGKIYQEIPRFPPSFYLFLLLFFPSEGVKSVIGTTFSCF